MPGRTSLLRGSARWAIAAILGLECNIWVTIGPTFMNKIHSPVRTEIDFSYFGIFVGIQLFHREFSSLYGQIWLEGTEEKAGSSCFSPPQFPIEFVFGGSFHLPPLPRSVI